MDGITRRDLGRLAIGAWLATAIAATARAAPAAVPADNMEKRRLGTMECSLTGLGLVTLGRDGDYAKAERLIHAALDAGINFFDSSNIYGNTPDGKYNADLFLGRALGSRRSRAYIATKLGYDTESGSTAMPPPYKGLSAAAVEEQLDRSLKTLNTDYIDLYQVHRNDPNVPIEETLGAFAKAIEKGKVRFIGTSGGNVETLKAHDAAARKLGVPRFISTQSGLSLLSRRAVADLIPALERLDMGLIPTTPLANGFLTGSYRAGQAGPLESVAKRYGSENNYRTLQALERWAMDHGHSMLDLAFAWVAAQRRVISIIAGATKEEQVVQNAKATRWKLTPAQVAEVTQIASGFDEAVFRRPPGAVAPAAPASRNSN